MRGKTAPEERFNIRLSTAFPGTGQVKAQPRTLFRNCLTAIPFFSKTSSCRTGFFCYEHRCCEAPLSEGMIIMAESAVAGIAGPRPVQVARFSSARANRDRSSAVPSWRPSVAMLSRLVLRYCFSFGLPMLSRPSTVSPILIGMTRIVRTLLFCIAGSRPANAAACGVR